MAFQHNGSAVTNVLYNGAQVQEVQYDGVTVWVNATSVLPTTFVVNSGISTAALTFNHAINGLDPSAGTTIDILSNASAFASFEVRITSVTDVQTLNDIVADVWQSANATWSAITTSPLGFLTIEMRPVGGATQTSTAVTLSTPL